MEDKDSPSQPGTKKWFDLGKTVGIMLQIYDPTFVIGKYVFINSDFCVEKGVTALE